MIACYQCGKRIEEGQPYFYSSLGFFDYKRLFHLACKPVFLYEKNPPVQLELPLEVL